MKHVTLWKPIKEFPDYEISEFGIVRRLDGKIMLQFMSPVYAKVTLTRDKKHYSRSIHRLVALAFLGKPPTEKHHAAHIDGHSWNNHYSNLKWCTASENQNDRIKHGTMYTPNYRRRLTRKDAFEIYHSLETISALADKYGVSMRHVQNIRSGKKWKSVASTS